MATKIEWKSFRWSVALPLIMIVYILAYIDRINISFAMSGMSKALGMTSAVGGFHLGAVFPWLHGIAAARRSPSQQEQRQKKCNGAQHSVGYVSGLQGCVTNITQL